MWEIGFCFNPRHWCLSWGGNALDDDGTVVGKIWAFGPIAIFRFYQNGEYLR